MSAHTNAKATRLLSEGRVRPDDIRNIAFSVEGDNGSYRVALSCDCKAAGSCSHLEAAMAWATASPDERAIMQQILDLTDAARQQQAADVFEDRDDEAMRAGRALCLCGHVADWHAVGGRGECEHDATIDTQGTCSCDAFRAPLTDEQRASGEAAFDRL